MKVILKKDVKDLGKTGDLLSVKEGYARNFLFPRRLATDATERSIKEINHLQQMAEAKKKKAVAERKELIAKLNGLTVEFKRPAGDTDKLFGSVTNADISEQLEHKGFSIGRRDIYVEPIKILGQHKAQIKLGDGLDAEIIVSVERA